jgi:radical SAM superfamily enzyme YgiQ (UPF0313 family)
MARTKLAVTLVGASILRESELPGFESVTDFASVSFNLAIASLKAAADADARLQGHAAIRLLDFNVGWDHRRLGAREAEAVVATAPDVVGISCYCWNVDTLLELAAAVRARRPEAFVIIGGPSAGPVARELLEAHSAVDAVAIGEGENTFIQLCDALLEERDLSTVPGIAWRDAGGTIVDNALPDEPVDLARLPSPYRSGVLRPQSFMLLETSRGCRYRCRFCSWAGNERSLRYVPAASIEADLRWALEHGVKSVKLADTAINFQTERVAELAAAIEAADREHTLGFTYFLKPELLDDEQVEVLARIPTDEIIVGVESLGDAQRRAVSKPPFVAAEFERKVEMLQRVGPVTTSFILGLPGDTLEGLEQTLDWIVDFDARHPDWLHVICLFWLAVLPGARLHDKRQQAGYRLATGETPYLLESAEHSPDDLLVMARRSVERHYRHPKLRVEYFQKDYLMQDAPEADRRVAIARRAHDSRRRALLLGAVDGGGGRRDGLRPWCLETAQLKAYAETSREVRQSWILELHDVPEPPRGTTLGDDEIDDIVARDPELVVWCSAGAHPERAERSLEALRARLPDATLLVGGRGTRRAGTAQLRAADHILLDDAEPALRELLETGRVPAPTLLAHLDEIPSPYQWGFVQKSGPAISMRLGRGRRYHGPARVYADVRWAIEQRHEKIVWLDGSLPDDREVLAAFVSAVRRADPDGRVRHSYQLGPQATSEAHLSLLAGLRGAEIRVAGAVDARALHELARSGARVIRVEPWLQARTLAALLTDWQRDVEGWTLQEIVPGATAAGVARLRFAWRQGGNAWLLIGRRRGAGSGYRTGLRLDQRGPRPPMPALKRLVWLVQSSLEKGEARIQRSARGARAPVSAARPER